MSAHIRKYQKVILKNPDLLSQIRIFVVEVTGFEPAAFWSRTTKTLALVIRINPITQFFDWILSDSKTLLLVAWQGCSRAYVVLRHSWKQTSASIVYALDLGRAVRIDCLCVHFHLIGTREHVQRNTPFMSTSLIHTISPL